MSIQTPSRVAAATAPATVFGMSWYFRSRNTRCPSPTSAPHEVGPLGGEQAAADLEGPRRLRASLAARAPRRGRRSDVERDDQFLHRESPISQRAHQVGHPRDVVPLEVVAHAGLQLRPDERVHEVGGPHLHGRRAGDQELERRRPPRRCRPSRSPGSSRAARTRTPCAPRSGGSPGRSGPPMTFESFGRRVSTSIAIARNVLTSDTASAPASSAAAANEATSVTLGVSFGMIGRLVARRTADTTWCVPARLHPKEMPALLDVRAGDVQLERGDPLGVGEHLRHLDVLVHRGPAHVDDHRGPEPPQLGHLLANEAMHADPLQADRVQHARRGLDDARRRVPVPLAQEQPLDDDGAEASRGRPRPRIPRRSRSSRSPT